MLLKASLHFHTSDDPQDIIPYSFREAVDFLSKNNFQVMAVTNHGRLSYSEENSQYAASKNILLIPGIELSIKRKYGLAHIIALNAPKEIEEISTFEVLRNFKYQHPEITIIAPHPFAPHPLFLIRSIGNELEKYIDIFDALEITWFYTKLINSNKKTTKIAAKYGLPLVATADVHFWNFANEYYCELEAEEKTVPAVLKAIKENKIINYHRPLSIFEFLSAPFKFKSRK